MARKKRLDETSESSEALFRNEDHDVWAMISPEERSTRQGIVALILPHRIIVDVYGMGEEIPFISEKHAHLKVGDKIEIP